MAVRKDLDKEMEWKYNYKIEIKAQFYCTFCNRNYSMLHFQQKFVLCSQVNIYIYTHTSTATYNI